MYVGGKVSMFCANRCSGRVDEWVLVDGYDFARQQMRLTQRRTAGHNVEGNAGTTGWTTLTRTDEGGVVFLFRFGTEPKLRRRRERVIVKFGEIERS